MEDVDGTTTIALRYYNELRDFYNTVKKEETVYVCYYAKNRYLGSFSVISTNGLLKEMIGHNESLVNKIRELENPEKIEPTIDEIKKMSVWKFFKWKHGNLS